MANLWDGILDPARATTWEGAGVKGGIPARTTIFLPTLGTPGQLPTFAQNVTTAQIQAAIDACPADQVVFLNAGTYSNLGGLHIRKTGSPGSTYGDGITLRGAGAHQTKLAFTSSAGDFVNPGTCIAVWSGECNDGKLPPVGCGGPQHTASWTLGYAPGTSIITLSSVTGLLPGMHLILDQLDDVFGTDWPSAPGLEIGAASGTYSYESGNNFGRDGRGACQIVTVVAVDSGTGQVTIDPPVKLPNYRGARTPGAWWGTKTVKGVGIEDLTIDASSAGSDGIHFHNALNCWAKGVRSIIVGGTNNRNIRPNIAGRITIRDCYIYGPTADVNGTYGINPELVSDCLFQNNITHAVTSPIVPNDPDSGSVYAYNYSIAETHATTMTLHGISEMLLLFEGNDGTGFNGDDFHGTHYFITTFRNFWRGSGPNPGSTWMAQRFNRFFNVIGDILSNPGPYQTNLDRTGNDVFSFGWNASDPPSANIKGVPTDPDVLTTTMRWGCYDTVTGTVRFVASENPSTITNFPSLANPLQNFPPSFYLASQPSWWGVVGQAAIPWPAIGPDVLSGNVAGFAGHVNKIPARVNFETLVDDPAYPTSNPRIKVFDGSVYAVGAISPPPPVGLQLAMLAYLLAQVPGGFPMMMSRTLLIPPQPVIVPSTPVVASGRAWGLVSR